MEKIINGSRCPWNEDLEELFCNIINNRNKNFFVTGPAGVGKSLLIRRIQQYYGEYALVCASTGKAAQNIDGKTVHSNFQIDPEFKKDDEYFEKINRSAKRIEPFKCIIIDEIGMLRVDVFSYVADCINILNDKPQLIVAGDFYQLEPVVCPKEKGLLSSEYNTDAFYAFNSPFWEKLNFEIGCLKRSLRHADDIEFANCLNNLKQGINLAPCIEYLNRNAFTPKNRPSIDSITLFPRNLQVRDHNSNCLNKLSGGMHRYTATVEIVDDVDIKEKEIDINFEELRLEKILELKDGARVMSTNNNPLLGIVNGSTGVIIKCEDDTIVVKWDDTGFVNNIDRTTFPVREIRDGKFKNVAYVNQFPLICAYALSIHKAQGMTLNSVYVEPSCFAYGQLYTGVSRVKTIKGLHLLSKIKQSDVKVSPQVLEFCRKNRIA